MNINNQAATMQMTREKSQTTEPAQALAPIFLVGSERSGTTLLRLMLDHHPELTFCKEFEFVVDAVRGGELPSIEDYEVYLQTSRIYKLSGLSLRTDLDYVGACRAFLEQRLEQFNKPYVGATIHRHFATLLKVWPNARFIYLKRDGRDVARSCIGMGWDGNVWSASKRWIDSVHEWNSLRDTLDPSRYVETSYEDLIADAQGELTRILGSFGLGFHEDIWQYTEGSTYGKPDTSLIAQWKRKLSPKQLSLIEGRIAPLLELQGYELSGYPPTKMTPLLRRRLWLQDRWARLMYRWRQYGVLLSFSESLIKRTGPKSLHRRILSKQHTIQNRIIR